MLLANFHSVQLMGVTFSVTLFIAMFVLVRQRIILEKSALIWFFVSILVFAVSVWVELMDHIADLIGVYYPPSLLFAVLITCIYFLLLNISVNICNLKNSNKSLTQELGLLKLRLEELEKKGNHD